MANALRPTCGNREENRDALISWARCWAVMNRDRCQRRPKLALAPHPPQAVEAHIMLAATHLAHQLSTDLNTKP